jgi:hypothetical protein
MGQPSHKATYTANDYLLVTLTLNADPLFTDVVEPGVPCTC